MTLVQQCDANGKPLYDSNGKPLMVEVVPDDSAAAPTAPAEPPATEETPRPARRRQT